jgi:hypothetical protein
MNFTPKRAAEIEVFSVDYVNSLPPGVTIVTAVWTVASSHGTPMPGMIVDIAAISGSVVSQLIGGGVPGVTYVPQCAATCSDGQVLILPEPNDGFLEVV